jgi:hypothetical protein
VKGQEEAHEEKLGGEAQVHHPRKGGLVKEAPGV